MIDRIRTGLVALLAAAICLQTAHASSNSSGTDTWVTYVEADGDVVYLENDRRPSLYTGDFADCLGSSAITLTRFDAAYYQDNMTVLFHLAGSTAIANDSLMMYIGVYAYGSNRFELVFNPCSANIDSLCPLNSSVPIVASGIIPVSESNVANVPEIAFSIPDFEGEAILRIFSNLTEQEIACYSAVVTNGNTFSHPAAVGSVLGAFTFVAMLASFATAIYGRAIPTMRLHYAHSLSVGVVFAVFQHIFFSGVLSVNWPSVLVAWWSNFAWAGGMINLPTMQAGIDKFIGADIGNTTEVGAAQAGSYENDVGGGYDISAIYKRAFLTGVDRAARHPLVRNIASELFPRGRTGKLTDAAKHVLTPRDSLANVTTGYKWYGYPVGAGLPLPGNYSGFAGTLAVEGIRVSNAFATGLIWFLILLAAAIGAVVAFKGILEVLARMRWIKKNSLRFFRTHWRGITVLVALRTWYLAFFMMMLLAIFQFTFDSSGGVKAVAAIVFAIFLFGISGLAAYAVWYERNVTQSRNRQQMEHKKLLGKLPWFGTKKVGPDGQPSADSKPSVKPFWRRHSYAASLTGDDDRWKSVHDDEDFTAKFGWLAARYRRSRWWFFTVWILYELLRAIFYGAASGYALAQVFGLLIIEVAAFSYIIWARPLEGQRLNLLVIYCLGFSKVATIALSATFDVEFDLPRITCTAIGIVIIVIQGILTIITMIAIVVGAISSHMSITRNKEDYRPRKWAGLRERYFDHLDRAVNELPPEPKPEPPPPEEPKFGFEMKNVRRVAKIEDEDEDFVTEMQMDPTASYMSLNADRPPMVFRGDDVRSNASTPLGRSRANSMQSVSQVNLPYGARAHRPSWTARDFASLERDGREAAHSPIDMSRSVADEEPAVPPAAAGQSGRLAKRLSRRVSMPAPAKPPALKVQPSTDSLRVGGEVSTRDTIGNVPAPTSRPRARSRPSSLSGSYPYGPSADDLRFFALPIGHPDGMPGSSRGSAAFGGRQSVPLTPALEREEWITNTTSAAEAPFP